MRSRSLVLLGASIALAALALVVPTLLRDGASERAGLTAVESAALDSAENRDAERAPVPHEPSLAEIDAERASAGEAAAPEPGGLRWIEGRVLPPPDAPLALQGAADVVVETRNARAAEHVLHRAPVADDGAFRAAFPAGVERGLLTLGAPLLRHAEPVEVELAVELALPGPGPGPGPVPDAAAAAAAAEDGAEASRPEGRGASKRAPVELATLLAGRLVARVVTEPPAAARALDGVIRLAHADGRLARTQPLGETSYAFGGLDPAERWTLAVEAAGRPRAETTGVAVAPGTTREVELVLEAPIDVEGRVVTTNGDPVAHGYVVLAHRELPPRRGPTDSDGRFHFEGVAPGDYTISATLAGAAPADTAARRPVHLAADVARTDLRLVVPVERPSIEGVVRLPDGAPAVGAVVDLARRVEERWRPVVSVASDASGAFSLPADGDGPWRLHAALWVDDAARVHAPAPAEPADPSHAPQWLKEPPAEVWLSAPRILAAPRADVELAVGPGAPIAGRVVDPDGAPVPHFRLSLVPLLDPADALPREFRSRTPWRSRLDVVHSNPDGAFHLGALPWGRWKVALNPKGEALLPTATEIEHGDARTELVLRPERAPVIYGVVRHADGRPGAWTSVEVQQLREERVGADVVLLGSGRYRRETDAEGRFRIYLNRAGPLLLWAERPAGPASARVRLELAPGEERGPIELVLEPRCKLSGRVLSTGSSLAWHQVVVRHAELADYRRVVCDGEGRFEAKGLAPGRYGVFAVSPDAPVPAALHKTLTLEAGVLEPGVAALLRRDLDALALGEIVEVEVRADETAHVDVPAPPERPDGR